MATKKHISVRREFVNVKRYALKWDDLVMPANLRRKLLRTDRDEMPKLYRYKKYAASVARIISPHVKVIPVTVTIWYDKTACLKSLNHYTR